ncbi:MAG: oxidoreductase [Planctomycetes bacterium]|nr:oxidoreductase [Planctomycetota bacterium]
MNAPAFHAVPIAERRDETPDLVHIVLNDLPAELRSAYTTPGQYVQIQEGEGKPGFFALANGPARGRFEFLIKRGAPLADALAAKRAGEALRISAPAGKGFPLHEAAGRDLVLLGVGSGLAPLRAVVHAVIDGALKPKSVRFVYGARSAEHLPLRAEAEGWSRQGVAFEATCSRPAAGSWAGPCGRVQTLLEQAAPLPADGCVFACGMKEMVLDAKRILAARGLPESRVFLNF